MTVPLHAKRVPAQLLLEDGRRFEGVLLGARSITVGEVVFNTAMSGYQEILTDPSYSGQLVAMTYPLIGNYGINREDGESDRPHLSGLIVRELARRPSNWRSEEGVEEFLLRHGVTGIGDVDVRALTLHLRTVGSLRGAIAPAEIPEAELRARIEAHPLMDGLDLAQGVSTRARYRVGPSEEEARFHVLAYDFGVKAHSPQLLAERGVRVTILPAETPLDEILAENPDGLFISNGPGDPAAVAGASRAILALSERGIPIFGICLGHQLIARAFGGETYKLPFGHHGGNHPVRFLETGKVEITAQNHGFAVRAGEGETVVGAPELQVTHVNLYDGTVEGLRHRTRPVFSVQYHPEAAPGPHDSRYLFDRFIGAMEEAARGRTGNDPATELATGAEDRSA